MSVRCSLWLIELVLEKSLFVFCFFFFLPGIHMSHWWGSGVLCCVFTVIAKVTVWVTVYGQLPLLWRSVLCRSAPSHSNRSPTAPSSVCHLAAWLSAGRGKPSCNSSDATLWTRGSQIQTQSRSLWGDLIHDWQAKGCSAIPRVESTFLRWSETTTAVQRTRASDLVNSAWGKTSEKVLIL